MDILAGSEGDPGCRWVLLALVHHGMPGLWGAKPVYPNVSRELGGHTVIATPVLSDHHGSSSQRDPSLGHRAWPRRIRSCQAPAGVSVPCAGLAILVVSGPFPRQAGPRSWLLGVGLLLS